MSFTKAHGDHRIAKASSYDSSIDRLECLFSVDAASEVGTLLWPFEVAEVNLQSMSEDELQVSVISLVHEPPSLLRLRRLFPQASVQSAFDLRGRSARDLYDEGRVTESGYRVLEQGRKWHHELPGPGAVGLRLSLLSALEGKGKWLLCCEEDAIPSSDLVLQVRRLRAFGGFDLAVFGPRLFTKSPPDPVLEGWEWLRGDFWGTHCTLWSPEGRRRGAELLKDPQDMQIDQLFASLSELGKLRCLVQTGRSSARQSWHVSAIQEPNGCRLCDLGPRAELSLTTLLLFVMSVLFLWRAHLSRPSPRLSGCPRPI